MRRRSGHLYVLAGAFVLALGTTASAQDTSAGQDDDDLPAGHPAADDGENPHAASNGSGGMPGIFQPPEDTVHEDPSLTPGTIAVELRDADDRPVPHELVTLGILINSIAKGDSRKHLQLPTDDHGRVVFPGLETASNIAYRVSAGFQGGAFSASPFQLPQGKAEHVVLHVYPVSRDISGALVVTEATVAAEIKDDRIQIEEALTVYNLGKTAWQPDNVRLALPTGFTAFNAQTTMSDQGVDSTDGGGKLRGTFPPGQHPVEFRWQLPWSGDSDVDFDVGLPPHTAIVRVMLPLAAGVKLIAGGFPPADVRRDSRGQSFLVTERRVRPDDARLSSISIGLHGLPTPGPGRKIATALAALAVAAGLYFALSRRGAPTDDEGRQPILDELLALEQARARGDVGPLTYEKARRQLIDALALVLARS